MFDTGTPVLFRIMDTSGNRPFIKIRQHPSTGVTHEAQENDFIKLKASDGTVLVQIHVTGYETSADVVNE